MGTTLKLSSWKLRLSLYDRIVCEVVVKGGPGDAAGNAGEETVQYGVTVLAVVGERNEAMSKIEFRTVARLTALKVGLTDAGGPVNSLLPETKIEEPVPVKAIVQADEFIDDAGADAKTEHEGHEFAGLGVSQQNEVRNVFIGDKLKELSGLVRMRNLVERAA